MLKNVNEARLLSWYPPQPQYDCQLVPVVSFCLPITYCVQLCPLPRSPHREEDVLSSFAHCWTNKIWIGILRVKGSWANGKLELCLCRLPCGWPLCLLMCRVCRIGLAAQGCRQRSGLSLFPLTWQFMSFPVNALVSFFCFIATNTSSYRRVCFKSIFQLLWVEGFCSSLAKATPFSFVPYTKQMRISTPWVLWKLRLSFVEFQFLDSYWVWREGRRQCCYSTPDSDLSVRYCSPASGLNTGYGSLASKAKGLRHRVLFKRNVHADSQWCVENRFCRLDRFLRMTVA